MYMIYLLTMYVYLEHTSCILVTCIYYRSGRSLRTDTSMLWATNWTGRTYRSDTSSAYMHMLYTMCAPYTYTYTIYPPRRCTLRICIYTTYNVYIHMYTLLTYIYILNIFTHILTCIYTPYVYYICI